MTRCHFPDRLPGGWTTRPRSRAVGSSCLSVWPSAGVPEAPHRSRRRTSKSRYAAFRSGGARLTDCQEGVREAPGAPRAGRAARASRHGERAPDLGRYHHHGRTEVPGSALGATAARASRSRRGWPGAVPSFPRRLVGGDGEVPGASGGPPPRRTSSRSTGPAPTSTGPSPPSTSRSGVGSEVR